MFAEFTRKLVINMRTHAFDKKQNFFNKKKNEKVE